MLVASPLFADSAPKLPSYGIETIKNISYLGKPSDDPYRQKMSQLDLYLPKGATNFPTLVYFHGGGMTGGRRGGPTRLVKLGVAVIAVEYRLYPKCKHPEYIEDCAAATAWTFKNIGRYGGDSSKIFIGGYSAGSYLAAMIGMDKQYLQTHQIDADKLAGLLLQSGHTITHFTVRKQFNYKVQQGICDENSPMYHIRKTPFPILLQCGNNDYPSRQEENRLFESMMVRYAKQPRERIEYREYVGTHGTLGRNPRFQRDTDIFLLKHSGLAAPEELPAPTEQSIAIDYRSCQGRDYLEIVKLNSTSDAVQVQFDESEAVQTLHFPKSGVIKRQFAAGASARPTQAKVVLTETVKINRLEPVAEYSLPEGRTGAISCPNGVRIWTEKDRLFFELAQKTDKIRAPQNGRYYTGDGIEIFVDRTPLRRFSKDENRAFPNELDVKQYLFSAKPDANGQAMAILDQSTGGTNVTKQSKTKLTSQVKADGYSMLVSIPLAEISPLNPEKVIGLNVQVNTFETGKQKTLALSKSSAPSYSQRFHYPLFKIAAFK
jgi:dienelactone hydrolase